MCGGRVHEIREQLGITGFLVPDFDSRDDVGLDTAHQMHFDPVMLLSHDTIFVIEPADKAGRGKARRIDSKIGFHHLERQAALDDQAAKDRRQDRIIQVVEDRV